MVQRVLVGVTLVALCATLAACSSGGPSVSAQRPPTTTTATSVPPTTRTTSTVPPTTTTTIDPVCEQNAPTDGCPLGTPAAIAWAQQQDQAAQAAVTQQAEQAYEQCLNNNAEALGAALQQTFGGQPPAVGTPASESCSTAGLTPAEIQQAQQAVLGPPPSAQPNG
jgi:hypothetical protein